MPDAGPPPLPQWTPLEAEVAAAPPPKPPPSNPWRPPRRSIERDLSYVQRFAVPLALFVLAFAGYQHQVDQPNIIVFDEAHYVKVGRNYTKGVIIDPAWGDPRPLNFEHPPVGKYLIAAGIALNGKPHDEWEPQPYITTLCGHVNPDCAQDARGWRLASTVVGASGIVAIYLLGLRLFNRVSVGLFAALFLYVDGMYFIHARLAMLDIFPTAFTLWALAFCLAPYRAGRWIGSAFLGIAIASKYYALYAVPVFFLFAFVQTPPPRWIEPPAADDGPAARLRAAWLNSRPWVLRGGVCLILAILLPFATVVLTYAPYLMEWTQMKGAGFAAKEWLLVQVAAFSWDFAGDATHPYSSPPWSWLPLARPVYYFTHDFPEGNVGKMYSIGNPVLWWGATIAIVAVTITVLTRLFGGTSRSMLRWETLEHLIHYRFPWTRDQALFLASLFFFASFLPWFIVQRLMFIFYMTFVVPSMALFAAGLVGEQWDRGELPRMVVLGLVILMVLAFGIYYPILTGSPIPSSQFDFTMRLIPWMSR